MIYTEKLEVKEIISDHWLSKLIGKPAYFLQTISNSLDQRYFPKGSIFMWSKIPVNDIEKLIYFQKLGFYVVNTNIQLSLSKKIESRNNFNIRFAKPNDELQVRGIAKNSFQYDRFSKDPNISSEIACKIKEEWAGNFFLGKRGNWLIVAEQHSKIVGFLQLIDKDHDAVIIDLIAVDVKSRGKGIAKEMISYAYKNCLKKNDIMKVGTQIENKLSVELYLKLGFRFNSASYMLHMHK